MRFAPLIKPLVPLFALLISAAIGPGGVAAEETKRPVPLQLALERPLDASMAPVVVAMTHGLFGGQGIAVTTMIAKGSQDAIARVASGESEFAVADLNELIRYRDQAAAAPVKAVFVLFNQAPYAVIARRSRGIHTLTDLEGKTLGVAEGDLAIRLWPALARQNGIKIAAVKQAQVGAAVREPILSAGQVDAVSGFSYLSAINLRDRGVPANDLAVLRFADYGCVAYGQAIIVNPRFAAAQPAAVQGFLRALVAGLHLAIKEPAAAAADVVSRMEDGSRELELERLQRVLADNILTPEVRQNGIGAIDPARFTHALDQIADDYKFRARPTLADIFDDSYLPPVDSRLIN